MTYIMKEKTKERELLLKNSNNNTKEEVLNMAIVQYQVLYRYVHPVTRLSCTNVSSEVYDDASRFVKGYLPKDALTQTTDMMEESDSRNAKYDMLFVYNGIIPINKFIDHDLKVGSDTLTILSESFLRCKGEGWFVSSTHASLQSALKSAEPLVRSIGKENVKVAKIVPLEISVGLE